MARSAGQIPSSPEPVARHSVAAEYPETAHPIEDLACQLDLDSLSAEGSTPAVLPAVDATETGLSAIRRVRCVERAFFARPRIHREH
jgi:hypothetical protein